MKQNQFPFKWGHFELTVVLLCVRWYHLTSHQHPIYQPEWHGLLNYFVYHFASTSLRGYVPDFGCLVIAGRDNSPAVR